MKFSFLVILLLTLFVAPATFGQKYLQKPYKEWSKDDAGKVLSDSPWATTYQSEEGLVAAQSQQQARDSSDNNRGTYRGNQGRVDPPVPIIVRLHSALPVRQASVRLSQIASNYDKLNSEEQAKFDMSTAKFLECGICKGYYVVTLSKFPHSSMSVTEGLFQSLKLEDLKGKVWLVNDKGEKLELTEFTPPKGATDAAVLFFKRTNDKGEEFFLPTDKEIKLSFATEFRDSSSNSYGKLVPRTLEFKVAKMVADGKLLF